MLQKINRKLALEPTVGGVGSQAMILYTNVSAYSKLTYSAEDGAGFVKSLLSGFKSAFPKKTNFKDFKNSDSKLLETLFKKLQKKDLANVSQHPVSIQDGLQVNLKTWIVTLDECYTSLSSELTEALSGLVSLFAVLNNDPDKIKSLSNYGKVKQTTLDATNEKFQSMFGSSVRSNRSTIGDMISSVSELDELRTYYSQLTEKRSQLDTTKVSKDIERINELADQFMEQYALRLAGNRRAVSDLSLHVHAVAEAISLLSLLDYSYQALDNALTEMNKKV